jgi:hypothetical protein
MREVRLSRHYEDHHTVNSGLDPVIYRQEQRAPIVKLIICKAVNKVHLFHARVKYGIGVYINSYISTV